jgi:putative DNA primase/helicase
MSDALQDALADLAGRILPAPGDPMAVARELVTAEHEHESGALLLRRWRGGWWQWETTHWVERDEKHVDADAYHFTEHAVYESRDPKTDKVTLKPWAPTRHKIGDLADALAAIVYLPEALHTPAWLSHPACMAPAAELVSVSNGLLHIQSRVLCDHTPELFNLVAVPFAYDPNTPEPTRWLQFLDDLWDDDTDAVAALQEYFGYVISGDTSQHKILLMVGPRRGGKGTIARVLKELLGRGNYCGPTLASLGTNFGLEPLIGKPLAIISDARLGGANVHQVVERLLSISGEDMLTIDHKYRQHWTGTLPTRFFIISNELPRFGDASGAIASRFILLTLTRSWLGRENTKLTTELLEELPGIMNWALDGLERLQAQGHFTTVQSSEDALGALQDLVSPVAAFVRERCEVGPFEVGVVSLYDAWKQWAEDNGHKAGSAQSFGRDLRAVVPALKVVRHRDADRAQFYQGVRLAA